MLVMSGRKVWEIRATLNTERLTSCRQIARQKARSHVSWISHANAEQLTNGNKWSKTSVAGRAIPSKHYLQSPRCQKPFPLRKPPVRSSPLKGAVFKTRIIPVTCQLTRQTSTCHSQLIDYFQWLKKTQFPVEWVKLNLIYQDQKH